MRNAIKSLSRFELLLWLSSVAVVIISFFLSPSGDILSLIASVIGVTALIFVAKGYVVGQLLCIAFAVFYGIISLYFRYYGEMITYLGMSAPIAIAATVSWMKNPYNKTAEVTVNKIKIKHMAFLIAACLLVTAAFYFILKALGTANLFFSTVSVATSFFAASLTYLRSPYYAIAYALNDVVLIVLWVLASMKDISYLPMVACFITFLANDLYGFFNWRRIQKRQMKENACSISKTSYSNTEFDINYAQMCQKQK